ncbi:acylphosphatase [Geotalea uraniireducens]|uniref:Acylphosphatase n=1 Tax=Geotalea uraniireducens TaxID=351604 RepID=A0ABN6VVW1_9BACT|nr:acylphosphatase [Geotalea uraniireducens]BDV42270.1 acylphosphatase [Geotalea uraniireducens]
MKMRVVITVKGFVQGVAFRHHTRETALRYRVNGWVKNLANGDVLGCFEGDEEAVKKMIAWCRIGPARARVDQVIVEQDQYRDEFADFEIRY